MARHSNTRRILKWTGAGLCVLVLISWCIHLPYLIIVRVGTKGGITIHSGFINLAIMKIPQGWTTSIEKWECVGIGFRWPMIVNDTYYAGIGLPFWLLLLLTAIPTAWLWHRDRRLLSCSTDHLLCSRCGYDLTGNTSGVCSECGEVKPPPPTV